MCHKLCRPKSNVASDDGPLENRHKNRIIERTPRKVYVTLDAPLLVLLFALGLASLLVRAYHVAYSSGRTHGSHVTTHGTDSHDRGSNGPPESLQSEQAKGLMSVLSATCRRGRQARLHPLLPGFSSRTR